jgi:hypothetical protein
MKRLLVLCSLALACGGEAQLPKTMEKGQALGGGGGGGSGYPADWLAAGPWVGIATYSGSFNYEDHTSQFASPFLSGSNNVATAIGAYGTTKRGIVITPSDDNNGTVVVSSTQMQTTGLDVDQLSPPGECSASITYLTFGPVTLDWNQHNCQPGYTSARVHATASAYFYPGSTCAGSSIQGQPVNVAWTVDSQCNPIPGGDWTCFIDQICSDGLHHLTGHYNSATKTCTPYYAYC